VRCAAVIPAYNESTRILGVLGILAQAGNVSEIIVVNDASSDDTATIARKFAGTAPKPIRVFDMSVNGGKGAAMHRGATETDAEVVLFLDADLVGLSVEMVQNMTAGVIAGQADMTLGVFRGGQFWTTLAQILVPNISGQRCILRSLFLDVPNVANARYGVELAITNHVLATGVPCSTVILRDVSHPTKELKLGIIKGTIARMNMYIQMVPYMIKRVSSRRKR
jgi:glycosyltransferase involved in cell wall biosynthesis